MHPQRKKGSNNFRETKASKDDTGQEEKTSLFARTYNVVFFRKALFYLTPYMLTKQKAASQQFPTHEHDNRTTAVNP